MTRLSIVTLAVLSLAACKKESSAGGGGGTAPTGETGTGTGTTGTAPPDQGKNPTGCNSDFSQPIVADYTLTAGCSPYTVKNDLNIDGYTLTIEAGVELKVADGVQINVAYYQPAKLKVTGSDKQRVKFTGSSWKGLRFNRQAGESMLRHVSFEGAGTEDAPAFFTEAHELWFENVSFTGAKETVLELKATRPLKSFIGIDASKSTADASEFAHVNAALAGMLTAESLKPPEKAVIWLHGPLESEVTLSNTGAAFRITEEFGVDPQEGKTAGLTIKEGVTVEFGENAGLNLGYYRGPAGLKIAGTKEHPVTFTRYGDDQAQTPWKGILFGVGARPPDLDFLVIEYAGGTDSAALRHENSRGLGKLTNTTFRHLKGHAVQVATTRERFTAFDGNVFEDVEDAALRVPLELAHGLGKGNTFSDKARVTLYGEAKKDTTLENLGAPYVVEGELAVNGEETKQATLTIAPGTTLLFNDQGKLSIGYYNVAKLVAKGEPGKPVTFGPLLGTWGGVGVYGRGSAELENLAISGTGDEVNPLEFDDSATGSVKKVTLKGTKKGVRSCGKVKPEGVTADKGVVAVQKCN